MARGLNHVYLVGCLTKEAQLKYTAGGLAILEMQLAGNDHVIGDDGQPRQLAWYHRVNIFGRQAEYLNDQLSQGGVMFVEGRLKYRSWEDQNSGQRRSALDITATRAEPMTPGVRQHEATVLDSQGQPRLINALNQVMLIGNLTRNPDMRYTPSGYAVTRLGMAVNEQYRDRNNQDQESVHFVDVQVWRDLAEACSTLTKGAPLMVTGRLVNDSWTDQQGNQRFVTRVEGTRVEFLTRGPGGGGAETRSKPQSTSAPAPQPQSAQTTRGPALDIDEEFPPEEDLPF